MKLISPVDRVSAKEVVLNPAECDVSVSKLFHFLDGFRFGIKEVLDSVFQQFGIGKRIRFIINKLAKARKMRKPPGTLGLKKFGPGKIWVKKSFLGQNKI